MPEDEPDVLEVYDLAAEGAILCNVILQPDLLLGVLDIVSAEDFYSDANRRIMGAVCSLDAKGQKVDEITLFNELKTTNRLTQVGGSPYLGELLGIEPGLSNLDAYAEIVADKAHQRRLVAVLQIEAAKGRLELKDSKEWAEGVERAVYEAAKVRDRDLDPTTAYDLAVAVGEDIAKAKQGINPQAGFTTGYRGLDQMMGGWLPGKMYILGGRPGMGKSALAGCMAMHVAQSDRIVVFISAEMPSKDLMARMIASRACVDFNLMQSGHLTDDQWGDVANSRAALGRLPLSIVYSPGATASQIRRSVRREVSKLRSIFGGLPVGLVVVDYLQLLNGEQQKGETRENVVARLSRSFVWMAAEFDTSMLVLAQLNRGLESRPDKRPQLADLRESGSIEQDGHAVLFVYREDQYAGPNEELNGTAELIVRKNRNGPTGTVRLGFEGPYMTFTEPRTGAVPLSDLEDKSWVS